MTTEAASGVIDLTVNLGGAGASGRTAAHLSQTLSASLWAGLLLVVVNLLILALGGYHTTHTWIVLILYFTLAHSTLVVCGAIGLARALVGAPDYLLVDEPTAHQDDDRTEQVLGVLRTAAARGAVVVAVGHDARLRDADGVGLRFLLAEGRLTPCSTR